jgi:hypothetical protein
MSRTRIKEGASARSVSGRFERVQDRTDKGWRIEMARNLKQIGRRVDVATVSWSTVDASELKEVVRDGLVAMNASEREEFIQKFEAELRHAGVNMRAYLVPLGIPGRSSDDLTPTEVAHMMRFLKLNVPKAMPAIERALASNDIFSAGISGRGHRIAA